jgi:hypothetical protein
MQLNARDTVIVVLALALAVAAIRAAWALLRRLFTPASRKPGGTLK